MSKKILVILLIIVISAVIVIFANKNKNNQVKDPFTLYPNNSTTNKPAIQLDNGAWPMYCHDQKHTCTSPYTGLTTQPKTPKWTYPSPGGIGGMTSSIAVGSDGKIYTGSAHDSDFKKSILLGYSGVLSALFPNGSLDWIHNSYRGTPMISMIESSPLLTSDGKIIYGKDDGHVYALDKKGKLLWDFATDDPYDPNIDDDNEQIIPSPVLGANNTLYISSIWDNVYTSQTVKSWLNNPVLKPVIDNYKIKGVNAQDWGKVYAIDIQTGQRKWVFDPSLEAPLVKKGFWGSPAIDDNGTIYAAAHDHLGNGYLYALNPDGTLKWKYPNNNQEKIQSLQSPPAIGSDGTIYVGSAGITKKLFYMHSIQMGR